jgi:HK97 family phage major capsid protein
MFDYRKFEEDAKHLQARVTDLTAKQDRTDSENDEIISLMGQTHALEAAAGQVKDAELAELREIVAKGTQVGEGAPTEAEAEVKAFKNYLRTGDASGLIKDASMSTTDGNGGYLVPEPKHAEMIELIRKNDVIFGNATVFPMTGDTTLLLPYKSAHGVVANATETGARSEQNAPTITSPTLVCYDYYSDQRATQQFLDSVTSAEDMLMTWMYEDIQEQAGADAVAGNGSTKIKGLFAETSAYSHTPTTHDDAFLNTNFLTLYFALPVKYRSNAKWIMSSASLAATAVFADPASANIKLAQQNQAGEWLIYGKPVLESDSAPAAGAGTFPIAFADIKAAYAVGIHRNTTILRDPYTSPPKIRFYSLARMGGCAWDYQACELLCCEAS